MELMKWLYLGPALLIEHWPAAGMTIAGTLVAVQVSLNLRDGKPLDRSLFRTAPVFSGLLWLIFTAYTLQVSAMSARVGGETYGIAGLRLDLLVLTPILYALTLAAIRSIALQFRGKG
jgi:hypothetical protein